MSDTPDQMRKRLQSAIEASRLADEFDEIEALRLALARDADGNPLVATKDVPGLFFNEGPDSAASIMAFPRHGMDPTLLEDHGAQLLHEQVIGADGHVDLDALDVFEARYAGPLSVLPGLQGKIDEARAAQVRLLEVKENQRLVRQQVANSPANLFLQHDPATATKMLFDLPDTYAAIREIMEWMAGNTEGIAGFRKAVTDYILVEVGVSAENGRYLDFMDQHRPALDLMFEIEQMQNLDAIGEDIRRSAISFEVEPPAPPKRGWLKRLFRVPA